MGKRIFPRPGGHQPMTPAEARGVLERNDWTQLAVALAMGVSLRAAQRWFRTDSEAMVPPPVATLLRLFDSMPATRPASLGKASSTPAAPPRRHSPDVRPFRLLARPK